MNLSTYFDYNIIAWLIVPTLIFIGALAYVTIGTLRIIFVSRGKRLLSTILGFLEVSIWLVAISQIMSNASNIASYIAYAAGYAVGNYVGIIVEEKMAIGMLEVRIILRGKDNLLKKRLCDAGFGVTTVDGKGNRDHVELIFTVVRRKNLAQVIKIINEGNSNAFYSVADARRVVAGVIPKLKVK